MTPTLVGILHAGPIVEPTMSDYLFRVLLHLLAFGGLAVVVRGGFAVARATRSRLASDA